jgi:hypothetical protein
MYCRRCGASMTGKEEFCAGCRQVLAESQLPSPESPPPKGAGGWLLLLCLWLTIVLPLSNLYGTVRSLRYHPGIVVLLLDTTNIGLGMLSLVAGVRLWRLQSGAGTMVKVFLLASPLHALGIFCLVVSRGQITSPPVMVALALRILTLPFLLSLSWYWYLLQSRRVRNSYGTSESPGMWPGDR